MRIIAGERRGHKIAGPDERKDTRPTTDFVREAMFNILRDAVEGAEVLDLFAGTGALGLEALSRGALRAIFVERDRDNVGLIRRNLATLRFEDRGAVVPTDAYRWARSFRAEGPDPVVVFVDPPYREFEVRARQVRALLEGLVGGLPEGSTVVLESGRAADDGLFEGLGAWDHRRYGKTRVSLLATGEPPARSEDDDGGG